MAAASWPIPSGVLAIRWPHHHVPHEQHAVAESQDEPERLPGQLELGDRGHPRFVAHGRTTTSFVHSAPVPPRPLPAGPLDQPPAE
jgi:hypothetical protein